MTNEPIYAIPEMDLYYRATDHKVFLKKAPAAWSAELADRVRQERLLEKILHGAPPPPATLPQVRATGIRNGRPVITIDGKEHLVEVLPPDYFSPSALYAKAMRTDPGRALHEALQRLIEAGSPRVRLSKRRNLPIVLDEEGHPLKITPDPAGTPEAWGGVAVSWGYLPIWDPPLAWKVLTKLLRPADVPALERAIWKELGKPYRPSDGNPLRRYQRIAKLIHDRIRLHETSAREVCSLELCARLLLAATGLSRPHPTPAGHVGEKREDNQG